MASASIGPLNGLGQFMNNGMLSVANNLNGLSQSVNVPSLNGLANGGLSSMSGVGQISNQLPSLGSQSPVFTPLLIPQSSAQQQKVQIVQPNVNQLPIQSQVQPPQAMMGQNTGAIPIITVTSNPQIHTQQQSSQIIATLPGQSQSITPQQQQLPTTQQQSISQSVIQSGGSSLPGQASVVPAPVGAPAGTDGSRCLMLDATTPCGLEFSGYPILNSFSNLTAFSESIRFAVNLDNKMNTSSTQAGCNGALIREPLSHLRFQVSFWCSFAVSNAIQNGCPVPPNLWPRGPILCQSECDAAMYSLKNVYANETICPKNNVSAQFLHRRDEYVNQVKDYCSAARLAQPSNNNQCLSGIQPEAATCGFVDINAAKNQCRNLPNDVCCQNLLQNLQGSINPGLQPGVPAVNTTKNTTSNALGIQTISIVGISTISALLGSFGFFMCFFF